MEKLLKQENDLKLDSFSNKDAFELGRIIIELVEAKYAENSITISIEKNKNKVFYYQTDGAKLDFDFWIEGKKNCVDRFGHSSLYLKKYAESKKYDFYERYNLDKNYYRLDGGSFPIILKNTGMIGSISISGINSIEDHSLCVEAITILKNSKK